MQLIDCSGSPRKVGQQQGEALRDLVRHRAEVDVPAVMKSLAEQEPGHRARVESIHAGAMRYFQMHAPELLEEIRGIGEGAGLTFEQALLLHTYNALQFAARINVGPNGCTAIAFADSPAGPMIFKTYDPFGSPRIDTPEKFAAKVEEENRVCFAIRAKYEIGGQTRQFLGVRMAGSLWTDAGVNDGGLAFAAASQHPRLYPQHADALPQHCIGTLTMLRCRSSAEARRFLPGVPLFGKGFAQAYVDTLGQCFGVEKTAGLTGFNPPVLGVAYQTNHVRSEALLPTALEQDPAFFAGSYFANSSNRQRRIDRSIPRWAAMTSLDELLDDLYHAGGRGDMIQDCTAQCQHWITTWSTLVFPEQRELRVTEGPPAQKRFKCWRLS